VSDLDPLGRDQADGERQAADARGHGGLAWLGTIRER
jgi:hypothetical protein